MGIEALAAVFAWLVFLVGFFGSVLLFGLALSGSSRPYALLVFAAAVVCAAFLKSRYGHSPGTPWGFFWLYYSIGVAAFGIIAYVINRLANGGALRPNNRWRGP